MPEVVSTVGSPTAQSAATPMGVAGSVVAATVAHGHQHIDATIILPTYNERENIPHAIAAITAAMSKQQGDWEILVVDDNSPDRTWELVEEIGKRDERVRCYRRIDRKGLSTAIVDGLSLGRGERLLVADADLQHDLSKIPELLAALERAPIFIGTRYVGGGGTSEWSKRRLALSRLATFLCRAVLGIRCSDPMSGYFAIRRTSFRTIAPQLNPRGYKLLMELLYQLRSSPVGEVPYVFSPRVAGESKLSAGVAWDFVLSLAELLSRRLISARFVKYAAVGLSGVAVQYGTFYLVWRQVVAAEGATALAIATAACSNYLINNGWTFRDRRHRGAVELLRGMVLFGAISGTGALINQAVTWYLHDKHAIDLALTMAVGILVATVWNYFLNLDLTWRGHARPE
ncbi:MAG TPA: glycosyltransferase family 2 protein [Planctomycetota bacterium]|nr:glycosyltransferase family 2 protein [Planctomycetota bacterium]